MADNTVKARKPTQAELRELLDLPALKPKSVIEPKKAVDKIDVVEGIARAIAQGVTFGTSDEIYAFGESLFSGLSYDEAVKIQRDKIEQFRQESPGYAYGAEIGASALMPLGLAGVAGKLLTKAPSVGSAVQQAVSVAQPGLSAATKVLPKAFTSPTAKIAGTQTALGAAYGAGTAEEGQRLSGASLGGGVGAVLGPLAPRVGEAAGRLIPQGVKTTLGQTFEGGLGSVASGVEDVLARIPIAGVGPTIMKQRALKSFNVAAVNEALAPLSGLGVQKLSTSMTPREAVSEAYTILGKAYDDVLAEVDLPTTGDFSKAIDDTLNDSGQILSEESLKVVKAEVNRILSNFTKDGTISKQNFKSAQMDLRALADRYKGSQAVAEQNIGNVVDDVVDTFFSQLAKVNPDAATKIKMIDSSYSRFKPLQYVVAKSKDPSGAFTASQLLAELSTGGRRQPGLQSLVDVQKPLQQLALDAQEVLPSKIVGSDTAMKEVALGAFGFGAGQAGTSPFPALAELPETLVKFAAAPMAVYNPPIQRLLGRGGTLPAQLGGGRASGMMMAGSLLRSPATAAMLSKQMDGGLLSEAQAGQMPIEDIYTTPQGDRYAITDGGATYTLLGE